MAAGCAPRTTRAAAPRRRGPRPGRSWRRCRSASCWLGRLRGAGDEVVQIGDGTPGAGQVEEEFPVTLWTFQRRGGDAAHVPAVEDGESRHARDDRLVMAGVPHHPTL